MSRKILVIMGSGILGIASLMAGSALAYYLRSRTSGPSIQVDDEPAAPDTEPVNKTFHSLKSEELLPTFKPSMGGVDWELETTATFQQSRKTYGLVIFATYDLNADGKRVEAHADGANICPALFHQEANGDWRCLEFRANFRRAGSWGNTGAVELVQLGPDRWGIAITSGFTNQGVTMSGSQYYEFGNDAGQTDVPNLQFKSVLELTNSLDSGGEVSDEEPAETWVTRTVFLPQVVKDHYVVQVRAVGKLPKGSSAPVGRYEFSPVEGIFKRVAGQ